MPSLHFARTALSVAPLSPAASRGTGRAVSVTTSPHPQRSGATNLVRRCSLTEITAPRRPLWRRVGGRLKTILRPPGPPTMDDYIATRLPHEAVLRELFEVSDVAVVFDIGSCEGEDSIRYGRLFPNARIYACEPMPTNRELITKNIAKYADQELAERITVVPKALSEAPGTASFYVSSGRPEGTEGEEWDYGNKSSSLLPPDRMEEAYAWLKFEKEIIVETTTLAEVMGESGVSTIDVAHMDIQGAELMALRGAGDRIADVKTIWLEVETITLYKGQALKPEIEQFMDEHGFTKLMDTVGEFDGDQLYVNTRFFSERQLHAAAAARR